jgi:hypothetical protein
MASCDISCRNVEAKCTVRFRQQNCRRQQAERLGP